MDMFLVTLTPGLVPNGTLAKVEIGREQGDSRAVLALPFLHHISFLSGLVPF